MNLNMLIKLFTGIFIDLHILQALPASNLNRGEDNLLKTIVLGGVNRIGISAQCFIRAIREFFSYVLRTKTFYTGKVSEKLAEECEKVAPGANYQKFVEAVAGVLNNGTLFYTWPGELNLFAEFGKTVNFEAEKAVKDKKNKLTDEFIKFIKENDKIPTKDVALFGRFSAMVPCCTIEGAARFGYSFDVQESSITDDYFVAKDDLGDNGEGASFIGYTQLSSPVFYRRVSIDLGKLVENLQGVEFKEAVEAFLIALYSAIPAGSQHGKLSNKPWDYAKVIVRRGVGTTLPWDKPIRPSMEGGVLENAIKAMDQQLEDAKLLNNHPMVYEEFLNLTFGKGHLGIKEVIEKVSSFIEGVKAEEKE